MRTSLWKRSRARRWSAARLGQEFERDRLGQRQVGRAVHFAHAAAAQQGDDPVAPRDQSARNEAAFVDGGRRGRVRTARRHYNGGRLGLYGSIHGDLSG